MTRRITLAILASVLVSVLLAGVGTLFTTRLEDRRATLDDLEAKADAVAFLFTELPFGSVDDQETTRQRLERIQTELRVADAEFLVIGPGGDVLGELPTGLDADTIDGETLRREGRTSGTSGSIIYAAAAGQRRDVDFVVILTADQQRLTSAMARWIVLSTLLAVAVGALIAWRLGRRLARPVLAASAASRAIAGGDLSARVATEDNTPPEIAELASSINDMAASLDRSRGLERQFLLSVSHDLRTPLTSIRGYAEAIADGTADPAAAATVIGSEARRLERLVTDLLDLARLDARQFRVDPRPIDLHELVPDVVAGFEHRATGVGVAIAVDGPQDPVVVDVDPDRLAQVLANLIENALRFATARIDVAYRLAGGGAEIVVADDGPGIATEDLPHIFERLYVATRHPVRAENGSGLGLAIVRELVAAMGGEVQVLPRPTGGSQFVVSLRARR